jgi:DNA-binding SARP family transcriptional activator
MRTLSLTLLGTFSAALDGRPLGGLTYAKLRALLAYLAVERDQAHSRAHLAALLWPDMPERQARHNLSQAIATLRTVLGDRSDTSPLLLTDTATIQLAPALVVDVDALRLVDGIRGAIDAPSGRAAQPWAAIHVLERAVALHSGELLSDLSIGDSLPFEDWAARWRARVREQLICALTRLMAHAEWRDDLAAAAGNARRLVELEPFVELAHRDLARLLALGGEPLVAL